MGHSDKVIKQIDSQIDSQIDKQIKKIVNATIKRYNLYNIFTKEDLYQYGYFGVIDAERRKDNSKNYSTYVRWKIKCAIIDGIRQESLITRKQHKDGIRSTHCTFDKIDLRIEDNPRLDKIDFILWLLSCLTPLERQIIKMSFFEDKSITDISIKLKCKRDTVFRIRRDTLLKMKGLAC